MIEIPIPADRMSKPRVALLKRLSERYPGDEPIMLKLLPPADCTGCSEKWLRLAVTVDGSAEFLSDAMGLFDG